MSTPQAFKTAKLRVARKRRVTASRPTPVALVLVSASFDSGAVPVPTVTLVFDRAIDISGLLGYRITVTDGPITQTSYDGGGGAVLTSPTTVVLSLHFDDVADGPDVLLDAASDTGIVAVDDGGTWAGVSDVVLPFG